ncbi:MAG: SpoIIE family protein phosphatase [Clostridia bacterium]|nr:SpoIIE family protein phosphatase [Clostridia bacterium]
MQENVTKKRRKMRARGESTDEGTVWRARLRWLSMELIYFGGACLLGQAPMAFGTHPLGLALLCAGTRHTWSVFLGLVAAALWQLPAPTVYICTYAAAAIVRTVTFLVFDQPPSDGDLSNTIRRKLDEMRAIEKNQLPQKPPKTRIGMLWTEWKAGKGGVEAAALASAFRGLFSESLRLRLLTGAICAFIVGLYRIITGGFQYYDLFAAVFAILLTPIAITVYSASLSGKKTHDVIYQLSRAAILFSLIYAADGITFIGIPLNVMLAVFFTLYATSGESNALGIAAGLLCGIAVGPAWAPAYLLAALVFSFFKELKRTNAGILLASAAMLAWSVYVGGALILITHLPACLLGGSAMSVVLRYRASMVKEKKEETDAEDGEVLRLRLEGDRHRDANDRFRGISDAFSSLSEVFYNLSDRFRRPGTLDLRRICDGAFDAFCADCPNKTVCWGLEYSGTLGTVNELISALHTKGKVTRAQIPDALRHRCETVDAILARINEDCAKLTCEMLRNNRTEIFAMDYESAADIINDALEEDDGEYRFDDEQAQKISEYLSDAGVLMHGVTVYGNRRRRILVRGADLENAKVTVDTMCADIGELCSRDLSRPVFEVDGDVETMILQAKRKISVVGAQNNVSADGGVSGDTVNLFSNKQDFFYALINDGMGAGREAALTSGLCSVFLEKMLRAGNRASTSLKMLNNMIRSRGADSTRECSSTVDLLELDLMTATASFIKSGAAPSFVVRGTAVHRLQAGTAPIGIIGTLDVQASTFYLKEGDTVVMVSDGILQEDPECEDLIAYLSTVAELTPSEIVYHICLQAASRDDHDDCSVIALRIQAAEE